MSPVPALAGPPTPPTVSRMALENSLVRVEPGPDGSVEIRDSRIHQLVLRVSDTDFLPESIQRAMDMVAAARATWDDYDGEDLSAFI